MQIAFSEFSKHQTEVESHQYIYIEEYTYFMVVDIHIPYIQYTRLYYPFSFILIIATSVEVANKATHMGSKEYPVYGL